MTNKDFELLELINYDYAIAWKKEELLFPFFLLSGFCAVAGLLMVCANKQVAITMIGIVMIILSAVAWWYLFRFKAEYSHARDLKESIWEAVRSDKRLSTAFFAQGLY